MKLDLRNKPAGWVDDRLEIVVDGIPDKRIIAFDTDARTIEYLAGTQGAVLVLDLLRAIDADVSVYGDYKGMATMTRQVSQIDVRLAIRTQEDLDELTSRQPKRKD